MKETAKCGEPGGLDKMPAYRKDGQPRVRNKYAANCYVCGTRLEPGDGVVEKADDKWESFCAEKLWR